MLPLMCIIKGYITNTLQNAYGSGSQNESFEVESGKEDVDALVDSSEDIFFRDFAVFKYKLAGARAPDTKFVQFGTRGETFHAPFN